MEEVTRLVSTGDSVKVWDSVSMTQLEQFNPHSSSHPVARACWSSNNQYLVTASSGGDKLVLSSLKSSPVPVVELAEGKHQTCVCLSSTSQFVVSGGLDHCVNIWDLKTKRLLRSLKDHTDDVTCVTFNANDSCLASSSMRGDVVLHSMTTHLSSKPLALADTTSVQDVRFSAVKRSMLGSCSTSGTVVLWDSNTQKALHAFESSHKAPSCSLAFSPTSDLLVVSVGLDKRVLFYDTASRIVLRSIRVDSPLTALDFTPDGTGLVVGGTQGSIYQYDLRNSSTPTKVTLAHKTSVTCLRFQNGARHKSGKPAPTKISSIKRSSSKPPSSQSEPPRSPGPAPNRPATSTGGAGTEAPSRQAEGQPGAELPVAMEKFGQVGRSSLDMFSPVRKDLASDSGDATVNVYRQLSLTPDSAPSLLIGPDPRAPSGDTPVGRAHVTGVASGPRDTEGQQLTGRGSLDIFSPLRDDVFSRTPLGTPLTAGRSFTPTPAFPSPLTIKEEEAVGAKDATDSGKSDRASSSGQEDGETPPPTAQQTNHSQPAPPIFTPEAGPRRANGVPAQEAPPTASAGPSVTAAVSSTLSNVAGAAEQGAAAPMTPLQIHFIQNMIHETLEEFRDECHKDVINLQVEMIRQFYIQLREIHGLLEKYSVNESLVEEIERLREENRQLRANY
ncbi:protein NEDD1 isoform X2 [Salarias fasciatus]|uniref:Uncharacterized protein n=1 Tax=Salarias fasciatus TaxID=181472 RepID=A0A672HEV5_SALFA|nr:protein NEDD1 isoform X2 [Salarias fasciatus]